MYLADPTAYNALHKNAEDVERAEARDIGTSNLFLTLDPPGRFRLPRNIRNELSSTYEEEGREASRREGNAEDAQAEEGGSLASDRGLAKSYSRTMMSARLLRLQTTEDGQAGFGAEQLKVLLNAFFKVSDGLIALVPCPLQHVSRRSLNLMDPVHCAIFCTRTAGTCDTHCLILEQKLSNPTAPSLLTFWILGTAYSEDDHHKITRQLLSVVLLLASGSRRARHLVVWGHQRK